MVELEEDIPNIVRVTYGGSFGGLGLGLGHGGQQYGDNTGHGGLVAWWAVSWWATDRGMVGTFTFIIWWVVEQALVGIYCFRVQYQGALSELTGSLN